MRTAMKASLTTIGMLAVAGASPYAASADTMADKSGFTRASEYCADYANERYSEDFDWACLGESLTVYDAEGALVEADTITDPTAAEDGDTLEIARVIDNYTSQVGNVLIVQVGGVDYNPTLNLRTRLYNQSATLTMSYNAFEVPVGLTWEARLKADVTAGLDPTLFDYETIYGRYSFEPTYTTTEDYRANLNIIPPLVDDAFFDLHEIDIYTPTGDLRVLGSVQSDQFTCDGGCTFRPR